MERLAGRIMLLWGWRRLGLAIVAGAIGALATAPLNLFAALFISFSILVWLLDGTAGGPDGGFAGRFGSAFVIGWGFGFGYFVAGLWWLGNALLVEADEFAWALPLAILGLPAVLAIYYGLAAVIARLFWSDGAARLAALAFGFGLAEWLRATLLTGFPWNAIGYTIMPVPVMMQSAALVGVGGMTVLAVLVFSAPALLGTRRGLKTGIGLAALLLGAQFGYGYWALETPAVSSGKTLNVRIVQPAIDQAAKLAGNDREAIFNEHLRLSALPPEDGKPRPDVIVWPETSIPFILTQNTDALTAIADTLEDGQILLTGAVRMEEAGPGYAPRYYNSVYMIDSGGNILAATDKVHLTPFGEYVPMEDILRRFGIQNLVALPGGFTPGPRRSVLTLPQGSGLLPLICYEAIFSDELAGVETGVNALLNVTNDGWFGDTPGPWQHLQQARIRAVENGLPLIRDANSGVSAIVDEKGRIISGLMLGVKGKVDASIVLPNAASSFVKWREINFWLLLSLSLVYALVGRRAFVSRKN